MLVVFAGVMVFAFCISGCQKSDIQINVIVRDMLEMEEKVFEFCKNFS